MKRFIRGIGRFIRNIIALAILPTFMACAGVILIAIFAVLAPIAMLYMWVVNGYDVSDSFDELFDAFRYGFENGVIPKENEEQ